MVCSWGLMTTKVALETHQRSMRATAWVYDQGSCKEADRDTCMHCVKMDLQAPGDNEGHRHTYQ